MSCVEKTHRKETYFPNVASETLNSCVYTHVQTPVKIKRRMALHQVSVKCYLHTQN